MFDWGIFSGIPINKLTQQHDPYDMELNIDNIADVWRDNSNGWTVKFPSVGSKERLRKADKGLVVSVMGIYNRGKTWVVNRLAGSKFSDGYM